MPTVRPPDAGDLHVPADAHAIAPPRYGTASLADVGPSVLAHLTGRPEDDRLGLDLAGDRVVVLVVDGLGTRQLARTSGVAPLLQRLPGPTLDSPFPSTTVTSLASLGTGLPPAGHGLVGYAFPVPGHDQPLCPLTWHVGLRGGGFDARTTLVPEALVPGPTVFEQAFAAGVATTVVLHPDFPDSGLSRAVLRGGERRTAIGLRPALDLAIDAVQSADGPALAYVHHGTVDTVGHTTGPDTDEWCDAVAEVDRILADVRPGLGPATTVLVTADHGMIAVAEQDMLELTDHPELHEGVRVLAGEPRARWLALEDGADIGRVVGRWRAALGDRALVVPTAEILPWLGPEPTARAVAHAGDVCVLARRGTLVHARVDPHGGRLPGMHGGATPAERLVPLGHLTAG